MTRFRQSICSLLLVTGLLCTTAFSQPVSPTRSVPPIVVEAAANVTSILPIDGQAIVVRTGAAAGLFYYDIDSVAAVDGTSVLNGPGGKGRYLCITAGTVSGSGVTVVNVKDYDAVGDGVADDTAEIQAAINAAVTAGSAVYVPAGTYKITATLTVPASSSKFRMFGEGRDSSTIDATGVTNVPALDISDSLWSHVHDMRFLGDASSGHGIQGLDPNWDMGAYLPQQVVLERLQIENFNGSQTLAGDDIGQTSPGDDTTVQACGIFLAGALEVHATSVYVNACDNGIYMYEVAQPKIMSCTTVSCLLNGCVDETCEAPIYDGCNIIDCGPSSDAETTFTPIDNTPRRNSATCLTAGLVTLNSHGCVVQNSKFKNSRTQIVTESNYAPLIKGNWIVTDVKTGVHSYGPHRLIGNTFDPFYLAPKTYTVDAGANTVECVGHGYVNGDEVIVYSTTTTPAGLLNFTVMFVVNRTADDFQLSDTSGGAALDITDAGTGTHYVSLARREIYSQFTVDAMNNFGVVSGNVFTLGGGGMFHALVHATTSNNSYPLDGVVENNYVGRASAASNVTRVNWGVLASNATRNVTIKNNVYNLTANMTLGGKHNLVTDAQTPGPTLTNNTHQLVSGTILNSDFLPANGIYTSDYENVSTSGTTREFAAGTLTDTKPLTISQTWNDGAETMEGVKIAITDTASAAGSLTFQVLGGAGGVTNLLSVDKAGLLTTNHANIASGVNQTSIGYYAAGVGLGSSGLVHWSSAAPSAAPDVVLRRQAANHLALRNSTNAQSFSVYNTWTSDAAMERGRFGWASNVLQIGTEHTGGTARSLSFITNGTDRLTIAADGTVSFASNMAVTSSYVAMYTSAGLFLQHNDADMSFGASPDTVISRPAAGVLTLHNGASDFNRLQFGGTTSSFPAWKRSAAGFQARLADDSASTYVLQKRLVEANTAGVGSPNILTEAESNTTLTNEGATAANYHTLPTAVAGLEFTFIVQDSDGVRVVAATGDTIRMGPHVTATAGYIESTTIGNVVTLRAINATEWIQVDAFGAWTNGTWTFTLNSST